ncbi:MAG: hypothetical protein K8I29_04145 [Alphaproteobacteria bacterium]|uniref:Uncharacterized protein n=1 Tax=Candidatus Nitrobium versatile TaxID=2884831 RepID=A0A953JCR3_9BACT|nr:hypothetical protein [Candidatus Nitrobium versatile]
MDAISDGTAFPVRLYKSIGGSPAPEELLAKFRMYLPDQPGSLAGFASTIAEERGTLGKFRRIESFSVGPLLFEVFESHGGHAPGQVFCLNREYGLLFTSDFLLNVPSLSPEEREHLSLCRYLLTNPNSNSPVYREETAALRGIVSALDEVLRPLGRFTRVFPGHADYCRGAGGEG